MWFFEYGPHFKKPKSYYYYYYDYFVRIVPSSYADERKKRLYSFYAIFENNIQYYIKCRDCILSLRGIVCKLLFNIYSYWVALQASSLVKSLSAIYDSI